MATVQECARSGARRRYRPRWHDSIWAVSADAPAQQSRASVSFVSKLSLSCVALSAILGSCSSPSGQSDIISSTSVSGTYAGQAVSTAETIGLYGVKTAAGTYAGAIVTNIAGACALFKTAVNPMTSGPDRPSATQLNIQVVPITVAGSSSPVPAGAYSVRGDNGGMFFVHAGFEATDANCMNENITSDATDGTVDLVSVSPTSMTGRFDLTFPSGDHLKGQFDAPVCDFDLHALSTNGLQGCGPADAGVE